MRARIRLLSAVLGACLASPAGADTLHLQDGSRLHGTILELAEAVISFQTAYAGTIEVQQASLAGLDSEEAVTLRLENGTRLTGRLTYSGDGERQLLLGDDGRETELDPANLASLRPLGAEALAAASKPESPPREGGGESAPPAQAPENGASSGPWTASGQLGLSGASGNTDRLAINGEITGERTTQDARLSLALTSRFAREDGQESEDEIIARSRFERDFSKRWFGFSSLVLERDEFEDLDLRSVLTLGTGVFLIEREDQALKARLGLAYQREDFMASPTEEETILSAGYAYEIALNGWLSFSHDLSVLPTLSDPASDFRFESDAAFDIPVSENKAWNVSIGVRNHFDNRPPAGNESLDTFYTVSLGYNFR